MAYGNGVHTNGHSKSAATAEIPQLYNLDAEKAILGAILIEPAAYYQVEAVGLRTDHFYLERHKWIFQAITILVARQVPVDFITLSDELEANGWMVEVGHGSLVDLMAAVPTSLHADHHARIVIKHAGLRHMVKAATKLAENAYAPGATQDGVAAYAMELAHNASDVITTGQRDAIFVGDALQDVVDVIGERCDNQGVTRGVPTGFKLLDYMFNGGLQPGNMGVLAGRPGMGKTSLALAMGLHAALHKKTVLMYSLEMSTDELVERLVSMKSMVPSKKIKTGALDTSDWDKITWACDRLHKIPFMIDGAASLTVSELRSKARRLHGRYGLDLIIVDYLQLLDAGTSSQNKAGHENRQQEITYISRSLKALAMELHVPVLALSQLNRGVEARADKRPMLSDLRESGSIEQDADTVMFTYRDAYYHEESSDNIAEVIVAKHRHGETGTVQLYFEPALALFRDLEMERTDLKY
jgi:replicative DNA helicase